MKASYTHDFDLMRTNIVIDDDLMKAALLATGAEASIEVVEMGLKKLVRLGEQAKLKIQDSTYPQPNQGGQYRCDPCGDGCPSQLLHRGGLACISRNIGDSTHDGTARLALFCTGLKGLAGRTEH